MGARHASQNDWDVRQIAASESASMSLQDYSNIAKVVEIDGIDLLDFNLSLGDKFKLFACGVRAAMEFLFGGGDTPTGFDWADYKDLRNVLAIDSLTLDAIST